MTVLVCVDMNKTFTALGPRDHDHTRLQMTSGKPRVSKVTVLVTCDGTSTARDIAGSTQSSVRVADYEAHRRRRKHVFATSDGDLGDRLSKRDV